MINFSQDEPGRQYVNAQWKLTVDYYLSSAKDYVVAIVDAHGSGGYGDTFKHSVFKRLGEVETKDSLYIIK